MTLLDAFAALLVAAPQAPAKEAELTKGQLEARSLCNEALNAYNGSDFKKALDLATQSLAFDPAYETSVRLVGWCAVATGDDRRAESALTHALNMNPADSELQLLLAGCHRRLEEFGAAKDLLQDLLQRDGPTLRVLLELCDCCMGDGDFAGATAVLDRASELAPSERSVADHRVEIWWATEKWEKATAELRALVALAPTEAPLRWRLAQSLLNSEKLDEAAASLEETARDFADDPRPHRLLEAIHSGLLPSPSRLEFHRGWLKEWNARRR